MDRQYRNHAWISYSQSIVAANAPSAVFLASFLNFMGTSKNYASALEIIDLQKYKVIRKQQKVRIALCERLNIPFVFVVGKN